MMVMESPEDSGVSKVAGRGNQDFTTSGGGGCNSAALAGAFCRPLIMLYWAIGFGLVTPILASPEGIPVTRNSPVGEISPDFITPSLPTKETVPEVTVFPLNETTPDTSPGPPHPAAPSKPQQP